MDPLHVLVKIFPALEGHPADGALPLLVDLLGADEFGQYQTSFFAQ